MGGVGRANIDGSGIQQDFIVVGAGPNEVPGAVAIGGPYLFWVQRSFPPEVIRATVDGAGRSLVIEGGGKDAGLPSAIAADRDHLYFNSYLAIGRADLNGGHIAFLGFNLNEYDALALDSAHLYFSAWNPMLGDRTIGRGNLDGTGLNSSFIPHVSGPDSQVYSIAVDAYGPVTINRVSVSPTMFRAAPSGPSGPSTAVRRYGATVSYALDKAEKLRVTIVKVLPGRTQGGRCIAPTTKNRSAKACTQLIPLTGSFSRSGSKGTNRFRFSGRFGGRRLKPGTYRLVATPSADGSTGSSSAATFQIKPI